MKIKVINNTLITMLITALILVVGFMTPKFVYADDFNADITDSGITVSGDIFGIHDMLPGDTYDSDITLTNKTKYTQKVYLYMDYKDSATDVDKLFADVVGVNMVSGDEVVHDGSLSQIISGGKPMFIATLPANGSKNIDIQLIYPFEEAHEAHANGMANIDWKLHTEVVGESEIGDNDNPGGNQYPEVGKDGPGKASPQTGQSILMFCLAGLGIVLVIVALILFKRKKQDKEEE